MSAHVVDGVTPGSWGLNLGAPTCQHAVQPLEPSLELSNVFFSFV